MQMNKKEFCQRFGITESQFLGIEKIDGDLSLSNNNLTSLPDGFNPTVGGGLSLSNNNLTSLPDGFNPTVGGGLYLSNNNLTSLPEGFNPTVGGGLYLHSNNLTSLPDGFNPTVGGDLYLHSNNLTSLPEGFNPTVGGGLSLSNNNLTSLPEGFNPTVGGGLYLHSNNLTPLPDGYIKERSYKDIPLIKWGKGIGTHIKCDGRFSEVISKKGNVWKLKDVNKDNQYYLVTDGKGKYAHGETIKQAKEDLIYKISNRDSSAYKGISKSEKRSFAECIEMYRVITGSCSTGVKNFIEGNGVSKKDYSVIDMIEVTKGQYGHEQFKNFFQ